MVSPDFWRGRRVLVTGHTGFKGGWLTLWLDKMGAEVFGYALAPPTEPSLYEMARVREVLADVRIADIRDQATLASAMAAWRPDIVFHLAAQALVGTGYTEPLETFSTNAIGTVTLLEAIRACDSIQAVVIVTTDKCYENREWAWGYRENDRLGGSDPYSASKACAELITHAYVRSFFSCGDSRAMVATARAGNVIGGGDFSGNRLVPDILRAAESGNAVTIRNPHAIRPWQHVLEPLSGYLTLAERLSSTDGKTYTGPWNFGPNEVDCVTVGILARQLADQLGIGLIVAEGNGPPEHGLLALDATLAKRKLGWQPRWRLADALAAAVEWHASASGGADMKQRCLEQIVRYQEAAP